MFPLIIPVCFVMSLIQTTVSAQVEFKYSPLLKFLPPIKTSNAVNCDSHLSLVLACVELLTLVRNTGNMLPENEGNFSKLFLEPGLFPDN